MQHGLFLFDTFVLHLLAPSIYPAGLVLHPFAFSYGLCIFVARHNHNWLKLFLFLAPLAALSCQFYRSDKVCTWYKTEYYVSVSEICAESSRSDCGSSTLITDRASSGDVFFHAILLGCNLFLRPLHAFTTMGSLGAATPSCHQHQVTAVWHELLFVFIIVFL